MQAEVHGMFGAYTGVMLVCLLQGEHLEVEPGPLGFALVVFCVLCGAGIILMVVRRFYGGELGAGTRRGKIFLTLTYLVGGHWSCAGHVVYGAPLLHSKEKEAIRVQSGNMSFIETHLSL
jgi:hypothetical protein